MGYPEGLGLLGAECPVWAVTRPNGLPKPMGYPKGGVLGGRGYLLVTAIAVWLCKCEREDE